MIYPGIFRGKIFDDADLRQELEDIWRTKTKKELSFYGLFLLDILERDYLQGFESLCRRVREAVTDWQEGRAHYQKGRDIAGEINSLAKTVPRDKDLALRTLAQIACVPHTGTHAMWASDYMVKLVNEIYPDNLSKVRKIREEQIRLIKRI